MWDVSGMLKQDEGFYNAVAQIKLMKKKLYNCLIFERFVML